MHSTVLGQHITCKVDLFINIDHFQPFLLTYESKNSFIFLHKYIINNGAMSIAMYSKPFTEI